MLWRKCIVASTSLCLLAGQLMANKMVCCNKEERTAYLVKDDGSPLVDPAPLRFDFKSQTDFAYDLALRTVKKDVGFSLKYEDPYAYMAGYLDTRKECCGGKVVSYEEYRDVRARVSLGRAKVSLSASKYDNNPLAWIKALGWCASVEVSGEYQTMAEFDQEIWHKTLCDPERADRTGSYYISCWSQPLLLKVGARGVATVDGDFLFLSMRSQTTVELSMYRNVSFCLYRRAIDHSPYIVCEGDDTPTSVSLSINEKVGFYNRELKEFTNVIDATLDIF